MTSLGSRDKAPGPSQPGHCPGRTEGCPAQGLSRLVEGDPAGTMPQNVVLPGPAPWGFRLSGGIDFNQPLIITRVGVLPSSAASRGPCGAEGGQGARVRGVAGPLPGTGSWRDGSNLAK